MKKIKQLFPEDYRHYICIAISLGLIGLGFLFPNALPRLAESTRDLLYSLIYYVCEIISPGSSPVAPSVNVMPSWEWAESPWEPLTLFPYTWEEFKALWAKYWALFASKENFLGYFDWLGNFLYYFARFGMIFLPLILVVILKFRGYTSCEPSKRKGKSKHLKRFERFLFNVVYPVIAWVKSFVCFVRENKKYYSLWLMLWLLYFNLFSVIVAALAFYIYFSVAWNGKAIYTQFIKFLYDLTPMIRFLPGVVWLCIGVWVYNYICTSMAFARLYHYENCNRSFLKKRGVVTTVYGVMGSGKTQLITSMALSAEIEQWDNAFEILLEKDLMFPNFPWQRLRDYLKDKINARELVDLDSVRERIKTLRRHFDYVISKGYTPDTWRQFCKANKRFTDCTFGYDFEHYAYTYNDNLKITHLFDAIEDYACAYLVYTVQTSLIFSNYSIRLDSIIRDVGNMPLRDTDFFRRDARLMEAFSRQCHIINYDMLRLGKRMQREFKLSFGVFVITEIDKERKNSLELKETKKSDQECNQNNDLFNACLMMCRHAAVISNRVFIRIIADLQRPEAWGAGGRELGEVIYIAEKGELYPVLPFISPYWLMEGLFSWIKSKWSNFHSEYIYVRRDETLFSYLVNNVTNKVNKHYDKVNGQFGAFALELEVQSGRMDGAPIKDKWRILTKKDRSARYKTDCLGSVFDTYEPNTMHIDDFICYAKGVGTLSENGLQNSYFQNDIKRMHEEAA